MLDGSQTNQEDVFRYFAPVVVLCDFLLIVLLLLRHPTAARLLDVWDAWFSVSVLLVGLVISALVLLVVFRILILVVSAGLWAFSEMEFGERAPKITDADGDESFQITRANVIFGAMF